MLVRQRSHINLLLLTLLLPISGFSQFYNTEVEAKIDLESNTEYVEITASAFNKTEINQSLRYILSVIKRNPTGSNQSKNDQSGRIVIEPGEKKNLSKTTLSAHEQDRIIILLRVYNSDDKLLGKDRIIINPTEADKLAEAQNKKIIPKPPDVAHEADDGVVLRGIVIEDTKTKPGRDFYSMFYTTYLTNNLNGEKIVTIKEVLTIGNNTKIEVYVEDTLVLELFVRPQNDYLRAMSNEAIKKVYLHFQKLKQQENIVKRY